MATMDQRKGQALEAFSKSAPQISKQSVAIKPQGAPQLVSNANAAKAKSDLAQGIQAKAGAEAALAKRAAEAGANLRNAPQLKTKADDAVKKLTAATQDATKQLSQQQEAARKAAVALQANKNNSNSFKR